MSAYACSLFEGSYHIGLGGLVNSLYRNGFRGTMFAGYRGELPPWSATASLKDGMADFAVADGCNIKFLLLDTKCILRTTNQSLCAGCSRSSCARRTFFAISTRMELFRGMGALRLSVS